MKQVPRGTQSANEKWLEREVKRLERRISIKLLRASPRQYWLREVGAKERFSRLIRKIARAFWRGSINRGEFWDAMADAIRAGFDKAWEWGAREVGIAPGELTVDELQTLSALKAEWYPRISDLAQTIYEKRQSGAKLKDWYTTVLKPWDIAYVKVQNQAKLAARANPKLIWLWNPAKKHCGDCTRLNTRVYRKNTWEKYDIYPQSPDLECTGKYCGCKFDVTDEPCTRGRPPAIAGQREKKGKK